MENILSNFDQQLVTGIESRYRLSANSHAYSDTYLDRFLEPNGKLIHMFGNNLSTLEHNQWQKIHIDLQKQGFRRCQTAFHKVKNLCHDFLGTCYDEHEGRLAAEKTAKEELAKIQLSSNWFINRKLIKAAGAAVIEIAAFNILYRLPQTPFFLPLFLNAGLDIQKGNTPLMLQLLYQFEENYSPSDLAESEATG